MPCVMTGASGFIGRNLLALLVERREQVLAIVEPASVPGLRGVAHRLGAGDDQVVAVVGDPTAPVLGLDDADLARVRGADHLFHVAVADDPGVAATGLQKAHVDLTRSAVELATLAGVGRFHHVSSLAVAGLHDRMLPEKVLDDPSGTGARRSTLRECERLVRDTCAVPWRIYRPALVVGRSDNGEIEIVDGPYLFFPWLKRLARIPGRGPIVLPFDGLLDVVPVDYVAAVIDHVAHDGRDALDGRVFHVADAHPRSAVDVLDRFSRAAGGPRLLRVPVPVPAGAAVGALVRASAPVALERFGLPAAALEQLLRRTRIDTANTGEALAGSGITLPELDSYALVLWDFWRRRLDPAAHRRGTLGRAVGGRLVMITGASSGIGRATALKVAAAGGIPLLVARRAHALEDTKAELIRAGGTAFVHRADLSDLDDCHRLVKEVLATHGAIDVLVNNAGRSIRRSAGASVDRFHDYERTMQLNYFGAVALILALLPSMRARRRGHIVNVSTIGAQTYPPRFSAYVASKAALDAFSRCVAPEVYADNIRFTTVHMPLVRTPMIAPTAIYRSFPALTSEQAADIICRAIPRRPKRVSTPVGLFAQVAAAVAPDVQDHVLNVAYRLFPESPAATHSSPELPYVGPFVPGLSGNSARHHHDLSVPARAMVQLLRGIHW